MKKILIMIISTWCLSACTQQEDDALYVLEVSAEIAPQTATRTTESSVNSSDYDKLAFDNTDEILIKKNSEVAVKYKKGTNTWIPSDAANRLTTNSSDVFTASYPTASMDIQTDQSNYLGFWKSKYLTSKGVRKDNKVTFGFKPAVAKISVVVTYGDVQTTVTASVKGNGICGGTDEQTIQLLRTTASNSIRYSFAGIIAPGDNRTYTITLIGVNTNTHLQSTPLKMVAGHNYQYTFTSTNELVLTGVTVLPFNDQAEEDSGTAT